MTIVQRLLDDRNGTIFLRARHKNTGKVEHIIPNELIYGTGFVGVATTCISKSGELQPLYNYATCLYRAAIKLSVEDGSVSKVLTDFHFPSTNKV